ncbi:MAG TPA: EamA family transporter, partial [Kofleriaceae bacterium]|nr:EamA family transporter [Kofleriaceae bacterium]
ALTVAAAAALATDRLPFADRPALAWSLAAGLFEGGYFITLVLALERAPLGTVYTVSRGGAILAVWPISALWLGEALTAPAAAGSALLAGGLVLAGLERGARAPGIGLAGLCALSIAGYHLCYKQAMAAEPSAAAVFAVALAVALPFNVARLPRARRAALLPALRARPAPLLAYGTVCAASFLLFLVALADAGAGLVLTLRNTSILFAVLFAWLLGEPTGPRKLAGIALVAAGAALLGLT